jgi:tetratricopeptide (TPR) repeat protein
MRSAAVISFVSLSIMNCQQIDKKENNLEKSLFRAMDYYDTEKYSLAIQVCDSIIAIDSTYDRAYFERAMSYFGLDSNTQAIKDFEKVESIDPRYPGSRDWHARALAAENRNLEAAVIKLEELTDYQVDDLGMGVSPWDWTDCAEYYFRAGYLDSAVAVLDQYFKSYDQTVTVHKDDKTAPIRLYAKLLLEKKDIQGAFDKMKEAMTDDKVPADYLLWIELNILLGDSVTARKYLSHYITEIHDGIETDDAKRLKTMLRHLAIN